MRRLFLIALFILTLGTYSLRAADVPISPTGPNFQIANLTWGCSGAACFNNNFFFSPLFSSGAICVYVYNNNTTSAHTFTATIAYTGDATDNAPSGGKWNNYAAGVSLTAASAPSGPAVLGAAISGAVQISVNLSGSSSQSGSPETAKVIIAQTANGNCMVTGTGARSFTAGTLNSDASGQASTIPIQVISDSVSQSFVGMGVFSSPGNAVVLYNLNSNNGSRTLYLDKLIITSTGTAILNINLTTTAGTTCSAITNGPSNLKVGSSVTPTSTSTFNCTGSNPTSTGAFQIDMAANTTIVIDLRGWIVPPNTTNGVEVLTGASVTGSVNTSFQWYEK